MKPTDQHALDWSCGKIHFHAAYLNPCVFVEAFPTLRDFSGGLEPISITQCILHYSPTTISNQIMSDLLKSQPPPASYFKLSFPRPKVVLVTIDREKRSNETRSLRKLIGKAMVFFPGLKMILAFWWQ